LFTQNEEYAKIRLYLFGIEVFVVEWSGSPETDKPLLSFYRQQSTALPPAKYRF
jgi:hypothetical protein